METGCMDLLQGESSENRRQQAGLRIRGVAGTAWPSRAGEALRAGAFGRRDRAVVQAGKDGAIPAWDEGVSV